MILVNRESWRERNKEIQKESWGEKERERENKRERTRERDTERHSRNKGEEAILSINMDFKRVRNSHRYLKIR